MVAPPQRQRQAKSRPQILCIERYTIPPYTIAYTILYYTILYTLLLTLLQKQSVDGSAQALEDATEVAQESEVSVASGDNITGAITLGFSGKAGRGKTRAT